jgi:hypothetical protein
LADAQIDQAGGVCIDHLIVDHLSRLPDFGGFHPGASITPSSVTNSETIGVRMPLLHLVNRLIAASLSDGLHNVRRTQRDIDVTHSNIRY